MSDYWKEIKTPPTLPGSAAVQEVLVPTNESLVRKTRTGAGWLWIVAGVSAANILLTHIESPMRLALGLVATDVLYAIGHTQGPILTYVALLIDAAILGGMAWLGFMATRFKAWAFVAAMVVLVLDGALLAWLTEKSGTSGVGSIALHLLAITFLFVGLKSTRLYNARRKEGKA